MSIWKCMLCSLYGTLDVIRDHAVSRHKQYFSPMSMRVTGSGSEASHGCDGCFHLFVAVADFVHHFMSSHVVPVLPHVCRCGSRFPTQRELERHIHDKCFVSVIKFGKPGYY